MSTALSFSVQREIQLRFLCPEDIDEVKKLCTEWFPIEYPDTWYQEITSNPKFYSLAATFQSRIVGIVVAEVKLLSSLNKEDADILAPQFPSTSQVAYILSLGVVVDFRKHGIASLLLDSLIQSLTTKERSNCKAVYLHVLATNHIAIRFYERRRFKAHSFLPYYYSIQGKPRDAYLYVIYLNGGKTGPFDSDANESSVDKGLILFPEKDGKAEPQKGWRRPFVSEFPLFNNASVSPEPLQPNAKPVFEPKSLEPTESDTVGGLTTAPVIMKSEGLKAKGITPDSQGRNRKPAQLEKIVHPENSSKEGKEKRKHKDDKEDYPENWVIPSLATAFAMPDPLKGSNRPPKFKPKRPKSNDLKNWTPEFTSHRTAESSGQEIDLEMTTSERPASGQRPKSPYRVTEQNESSTDDQVPYSLYPDTKTPML
ncbi:Hypothetical predicted protein [Mytilus galloprovincialis]|uniref:N-alpha-acetyltransferase 60 n=1 Tax=Mytilus galloprovincialis TaxID=29158 RepID=A0A8B6BLD0_MYTGA|nr:Hypothetical predicted protein [Mytilus galloprovincialis]